MNYNSEELASELVYEFGTERSQAIAWEMYRASILKRGELYRILRIIRSY